MNTTLELNKKVKVKKPLTLKSKKSEIKTEVLAAPAIKGNISFVIEEDVNWKWKNEVKNKNVWRKEEFIRTKTKEDALQAAAFLLNKPHGLTYTITVFKDEEYFTYYRHSMPCYGGLTFYKDSHGEKYFFNPYFPRDIYVAFPEGEIIFIGIYRKNMLADLKNSLYCNFILSSESPWVAAFGDKDTIIFEDNYFILTNMKTDPTVLYSMLRFSSFMGGYGGVIKKDWNPKADILLNKCSSGQADPRRLAGAKPIKTSAGFWSESFGYTRGMCEYIFSKTIPTKLKDFRNFPSTNSPPAPPFDNSYFSTTMKEKFGVDVKQVNQKLHDALVSSWDFFRGESKELSDIPGV